MDITDWANVWVDVPRDIAWKVGFLVRYRLRGGNFLEEGVEWKKGVLAGRWNGYAWVMCQWDSGKWLEGGMGSGDGAAAAAGGEAGGKGNGKEKREDDFRCWSCGHLGHG